MAINSYHCSCHADLPTLRTGECCWNGHGYLGNQAKSKLNGGHIQFELNGIY